MSFQRGNKNKNPNSRSCSPQPQNMASASPRRSPARSVVSNLCAQRPSTPSGGGSLVVTERDFAEKGKQSYIEIFLRRFV